MAKMSRMGVGHGGSVVPMRRYWNQPTRRKQDVLKKVVVCVKAEDHSTEQGLVPTDIWAWRKYGQKPIKGSPHPR